MPNETDERIAREQAAAHPPSFAETFGEDLGQSFDVGPSLHPSERSTAARIGRGVKARERAVAQRRDLAVVERAAAELDDDRAFDEFMQRREKKQNVSEALLIRAARAARRHGSSLSTAEQLAAKVLSGRQTAERS